MTPHILSLILMNFLFGAGLTLGQNSGENSAVEAWMSLFDGKELGKWKSTPFGGEGEVAVEDGQIILPMGNDMTGITWQGEFPRTSYEVSAEAMKIDGHDFFCGLTFPVGADPCSLILGGWGGSVSGLSNIDGRDASDNQTTKVISYQNNEWYRVKLRVTGERVQAWLNGTPIVDLELAGHRIGIRPEVELSKPLGFSTWRTKGALRNLQYRRLK
jgi:hypothetical protein